MDLSVDYLLKSPNLYYCTLDLWLILIPTVKTVTHSGFEDSDGYTHFRAKDSKSFLGVQGGYCLRDLQAVLGLASPSVGDQPNGVLPVLCLCVLPLDVLPVFCTWWITSIVTFLP